MKKRKNRGQSAPDWPQVCLTQTRRCKDLALVLDVLCIVIQVFRSLCLVLIGSGKEWGELILHTGVKTVSQSL